MKQAGPSTGGHSATATAASGDPEWYRDAVVYEVHVRSFYDSNGDGIGDFRGLTEKLDYLSNLGVTALWLLPFYPSPLRDDGYDIADYVEVNPTYGTIRDAETFIREAHKRGLRIITELVCNHTSDQHPWFQRARRAKPGSTWRDFYVWSDTPDRYPEARIIFKDFESSNWTWDAVAGAYYWHRFYSHQPDLNFDNPRVRLAITKAMDFWLDRGVDGLRLDAVPYLFERDGTDCENLPETHAFLRDLRRHVDARYGDRMLLAEANQWPDDSAAYFGDGDECHMAFNFPVMPRMFMAIQMEDRMPIIDIVEQTPPIPANAQWALFLRNHDELTLEMVTDEERDYMYRVYAGDPRARVNMGIRRRLAPLLGNHRRRIELMYGLLFSLPGTPFIYYGDEIGMGDNVYLGDRDSVRTPMQWSGDRNAGFSTADREQLFLPVITDPEHNYEAVNVSVQQANPHSLLWWMKRLITLRKRHPAFGRGDLQFLHPENHHVLGFVRSHGDETILVVANLSRFFQPVELDLAGFKGRQAIEMFGRIEFPTIGREPYRLSLGPHEFLWFTLESPGPIPADDRPPELDAGLDTAISRILDGSLDASLTSILGRWLEGRPWYRGDGRRVRDCDIVDRVEVPISDGSAALVVMRVGYPVGDPDTYLIPLTTSTLSGAGPGARIAVLSSVDDPGGGFLVDASTDPRYTSCVIDQILKRRTLRGSGGELRGVLDPRPRKAGAAGTGREAGTGAPASTGLVLDLNHTFEPGPHPEAELMRFLADHHAVWAPHVFGELEYLPSTGESGGAALLREAVARHRNAADVTRHALLGFLEQAAATPEPPRTTSIAVADLLRTAAEPVPQQAHVMVGSFLETARSIGSHVGEFHTVLASAPDDPAFAPEPFTRLYQRSLYQSLDALVIRVLRHLAADAPHLEGRTAEDAKLALGQKAVLRNGQRLLLHRRFGGSRIRIYGALGLDQIMVADRGRVIMGFSPDTARPSRECRIKRSPLRDVAAMLRSIHDVALGRLREADAGGSLRPEDAAMADLWTRQWYVWVASAFLRGYRESTGEAAFLPSGEQEWTCLLEAFLTQEMLEGLDVDLRRHPGRVSSSLRGLLELLGQ